MPKKDLDVWDPPEDIKIVEEPPSAFMQHFQNRVVRVGKDGSNAQLLRIKHVKPIQWTQKNKNNQEHNLAPASLGNDAHMKKNNMMMPQYPTKTKGCIGGIMAPDEVKKLISPPQKQLPPKQQQQQFITFNNGSCSSSNLGQPTGSLFGVSDVDHGEIQKSMVPVIESSSLLTYSYENKRKVVGSAPVALARPLPLDHPFLADRSESPEIISVEGIHTVKPLGSVPFSRMGPDFIENGKLIDRPQKPLTRLPPRKIDVLCGDVKGKLLMPKSLVATPSIPVHIEQGFKKRNDSIISNDNNGYTKDVSSTVNKDAASSVVHSDRESPWTEDELENIPLYQPTGLFLVAQPGSLKKGAKGPVVRKQTSRGSGGGGNIRPASDQGPGICRQQGHNVLSTNNNNNARVENKKIMSVTAPGKPSPPARLQPVVSSPLHLNTLETSEDVFKNITDDEQQEKVKKKAYKPYSQKDYKLMMEQVANLKLGGLGPANTDEQRQAKEKMERQRQYGELVEKQAIEKIREKQQQQEQQQSRNGTPSMTSHETSVNKLPRQPPPPPERIQAKERRERALEYARNLPRPEPPSASRERKKNDDANDDGDNVAAADAAFWRTPKDEAAWHREKRLKELEAKHISDRERVAAVKRQLGY